MYALAHPSDKDRLPPGTTAFVTGDPCFDSLIANQRHRESYRRDLNIDPNQKLIVISSTWGKQSLFGVDPSFVTDTLGQLPVDEYAVACVLHPNIWIGHGTYQVRLWLRRALNSGLRLIPFETGWRQTILAADAVIGDHGSVTFYAAALGTPVCMVPTRTDEILAGTPLAQFYSDAPRTSSDSVRHDLATANLLEQWRSAAELRNDAFAWQGQVLNRTQELIYNTMSLSAPLSVPAIRAFPQVVPEYTPPTSHLVTATPSGRGRDHTELTIERFPAARTTAPPARSHLVVSTGAGDVRQLESASILLHDTPSSPRPKPQETAIRSLRRALDEYPGALLATTQNGPRTTLAVTSTGHTMTATADIQSASLPAEIGGSVIREWILHPEDLSLPVQVTAGHTQWIVHLAVIDEEPEPEPRPVDDR